MTRVRDFLERGGTPARVLLGLAVLLLAGTALLSAGTVSARDRRDAARMVFNHNLTLLEDVQRTVGAVTDSLQTIVDTPVEGIERRPYVVASIADRRLW